MKTKSVYIEKRNGFDIETQQLKSDIIVFFGKQFNCLAALQKLRILYRYDAGGLTSEQFEKAVSLVLSEPQSDHVYFGSDVPLEPEDSAERTAYFGVEYLPGQYDQRADWAEQCIELAVGIKPVIRFAKFFVFRSSEALCSQALKALQAYLVNPVDSRLLNHKAAEKSPEYNNGNQLAMSGADLAHCENYFKNEGRNPTETELRVLDTYWSDHCRHSTFTTALDSIKIEGERSDIQNALALYEAARQEVYGSQAPDRDQAVQKPRSLMDMATIGAKLLKKRGYLSDLDESAEINACTIKINAKFAVKADKNIDSNSISSIIEEPYFLLFKNETHNHPTEIEPFGGAATCLGGGIRDPLSGRSYVYQAMRITGGGDPRQALEETLPGKLPQKKIAREAAAGYSSYGNQIGIAAGQVAEFYHPGFLAKRMELGALIGAVPQSFVRRSAPEPGDLVLLIGGKTGRDGIGGAVGSSKGQTGESAEKAGAEVQKGDAVEERKLLRLFRDPQFCRLVKRCNDFGAGGVSVAVGELAPGLDIDLDSVPVKYPGLDGTELAVSESQERMAVVCAPSDAQTIIQKAATENLEAVVIARVTCGDAEREQNSQTGCDARLRMSWQGITIVDLSRSFLDTNGASRSASALIVSKNDFLETKQKPETLSAFDLLEQLKTELASLRSGSRRGLQEYFDGSAGAGSVLFPWGGAEQGTPECGMAALIPPPLSENLAASLTSSLMTFGFDPYLMELDPYTGAKGAVKEALVKMACLGGDYRKARLSMQEYFERMESPESWGKVCAALLGALEGQLTLEVPAIGGKDSMSGTYIDHENYIKISVPPTLIVIAAGITDAALVRSGALSGKIGNPVILLYTDTSEQDEWAVFKANMKALALLTERNLVKSAYPIGAGGIAAALALMAFGNNTGVEAYADSLNLVNDKNYPGALLAELDAESLHMEKETISELLKEAVWKEAGQTIKEPVFKISVSKNQTPSAAEVSLFELRRIYEGILADIYPNQVYVDIKAGEKKPKQDSGFPADSTVHFTSAPAIRRLSSKPLVLIPVFPGTICEWDTEQAFREAGARIQTLVFRNRRPEDISDSVMELVKAINEAQIISVSGGFSPWNEPDGTGALAAAVLRKPAVSDAICKFLEKRGGLMLGINSGFHTLLRLGLVPNGCFTEVTEHSPLLASDNSGRHVSRMAHTIVMPAISPWLALEKPGTVYVLPQSHSRGRLFISEEKAQALFKAGQVPFCYSDYQIEALSSPDGRILAKMGHSERCGQFVHSNIPGNKIQTIFKAGVQYFS